MNTTEQLLNLLETTLPTAWQEPLAELAAQTLHADSTVSVNASLKVTPLILPHRDEYSETVGFIIQSYKTLL